MLWDIKCGAVYTRPPHHNQGRLEVGRPGVISEFSTSKVQLRALLWLPLLGLLGAVYGTHDRRSNRASFGQIVHDLQGSALT